MSVERKSETLIISDHFMAEPTRWWGICKWKIWRISDIVSCSPDKDTPPGVWYARSGHDAMAMMTKFEASIDGPTPGGTA